MCTWLAALETTVQCKQAVDSYTLCLKVSIVKCVSAAVVVLRNGAVCAGGVSLCALLPSWVFSVCVSNHSALEYGDRLATGVGAPCLLHHESSA